MSLDIAIGWDFNVFYDNLLFIFDLNLLVYWTTCNLNPVLWTI